MTTIDLPVPALPWISDRGISDDAAQIRNAIADLRDEGTSIHLRERSDALDLAALAASEADWDGQGARAVSPAAVVRARALLSLLSTTIPTPDVHADPDGDLIVEWYVSDEWMLTLAIDGAGYVAYAGLFGSNRIRGFEMVHDVLPPALAVAIARVVARAPLGAHARR